MEFYQNFLNYVKTHPDAWLVEPYDVYFEQSTISTSVSEENLEKKVRDLTSPLTMRELTDDLKTKWKTRA